MAWALGGLIVMAVAVAVLVRVLEPRMAFFASAGVQETPASFGVAFTEHRIATADGETLHAWWLEHPSPRAQAIYWHGNGGNLSMWLPVLVDLRNRGISVLGVDYRGYGASTGRPSESGIYRDADAATAYFAQLRKPDLPFIQWGRSLGCAVASHASANGAPDGLILESPFPDVAFLFRRNPLMRVLSLLSTYSFATDSHLQRYRGPLLVVHGDADSIIPFDAGRRVFERAASASKSMVVLKGLDHNDPHTASREYAAAIDRFLSGL